MWPVSTAFLTALRQPALRSVTSLVASDGTTLYASGGRVEMDSRRGIVRTCSLDLTPTDELTLEQVYELVMTPRVEVTVSRGLLLDDGSTTELVPLGVFSTDSAKLPSSGGTVAWSGSDRSKKVSRARFTDAYQIASGTTLAAAGAALLTSRFPSCPTDFSNVTETLTATVTFDGGASSDPWALAQGLFADFGYLLTFDGDGTAKAITIPDPSGAPSVFDFGAGETQLVISSERSGSMEQTYNGVIVTGESSSGAAPVRAEVWDTDPTSPTYVYGGFGRVPYFYSSSILTTVAQCTAAATTRLAKVKGRQEQLAWPAIVNSALEPLDVVSVTIDETTSTLVLDKLSVPLRASEPMSCTARETTRTN